MCGYRGGATTIAVAFEDDPRSSQGTAEVTGGDDRLARTLDDRLRPLHHRTRRWTIDYDQYIDALFVGPGCSDASSAALRV